MTIATIALLCIGGSVFVQVRESVGVDLDEGASIAHAIARAMDTSGHGPAEVLSVDWQDCTSDEQCLERLFVTQGASAVVLLRLIAGVRRTRIVADRHDPTGLIETATVSFERDAPDHDVVAQAIADQLFVVRPTSDVPRGLTETRIPKVTGPPIATWVALGTGAAALTVGVVLGLDARSTDTMLESNIFPRQQHDMLLAEQRRDATIANIGFSVGTIAIATGLVWWWLD